MNGNVVLRGHSYQFNLRVNRQQGLFFFDAAFRPVPLEQHFVGVRGKVRSEQSKRNMDQAVFDKVRHSVALCCRS